MANTYLKRTNGSPTNDKIGTISVWVKRSKLGTNQYFHMNFADGSNYGYFSFTDEDVIKIYSVTSGSQSTQIRTNRKFRDVNAWYHIVIAIDTTQGTTTNRIKIYVNGVQETSMSNTDYFGLNVSCPMFIASGSNYHTVGSAENGTVSFDGSMSHYHKCDGTALAPTVFGETDATTGEWKIKVSPSFTVGNTGYTILKDGNTITDQSTNSNNFTVGGGTLTKTEDCPDNVFATLNPLSGSLSNNTLSNGNNTIAVTSGWRWRPSTIAPSSGKYYAEFKPTSGGSIYTVAGVTPQVSWKDIDGEVIGSGANSENKSVGYQQDGQVKKGNSTQYTGSSYTTNDIIGVALDLDNHKVYFSKNGTYQNSGDPTSGSTGTGAISLDTTLDDWSISISVAGSTTSANYGNGYFGTTAVSSAGTNASGIGIFEYDVPTGYTALSTKGLNL